MKLKREINLPEAILYGVGILVGAGIYSLIGIAAGVAGNALWLSFALGAFVAICTVFSYAELSGIINRDAVEYHYTKKAFSSPVLSFIISWLLIIASILVASTVSIAFAGYFSGFFGGSPQATQAIAILLILAMSSINYLGIKYSALFNSLASVLAILGLLLIVVFGFLFVPPAVTTHANFFELPPLGFLGVISGVSLIFFAYIGFENLANLVEEIQNPKHNLPKALIISLLISTIIYILVSISAVNIATPAELASTNAPLAFVGSRILGSFSPLISISALFATASSCLIFLLAASRMIYGMAESGALPKVFFSVNKNGTPSFALMVSTIAALISLFLFSMTKAAEIANLSVFIAYLAVNISLIVLSKRAAHQKNTVFSSPRVFGIPIFAFLGALSCIFFLAFFSVEIWAMGIVFAASGLLLCFMLGRFRIYGRRRKNAASIASHA
ncbi:amino acid permease [Candidatus Micrarchaeota archaeon]|nr:amino acid permease [Candidatus Micrarchaeota archaeon]